MAAIRVQLAQAVLAELATGVVAEAFSQAFTARRTRLPRVDVRALKENGLTVLVVPKNWNEELLSRHGDQVTVQVDIGVQKKLDDSDLQDQLDALDALVEELMAFFRRRPLSEMPTAAWMAMENPLLYSPEHMEEKRVYTSVITMTYMVML